MLCLSWGMKLGALPISPRQLQYIVAVAEELSFRGAARRCFVSQPALSAQLAEAERALGVRLFERDRRRVLITPAGEAVVARARAVLLDVQDLIETAERHVDPLRGELRLGVIPTIAPYLLPELGPTLREAFPELRLRWREDKTERLVEAVERGDLEGALLAVEADLGSLDYATLCHDPFVLAAPVGHALAAAEGPLALAALAEEQVLLLDDGHCFRAQALALCATAGAREPGYRATSLSTLVQMVTAGEGVTLLPSSAVEVENRHGQLVVRPFLEPAPHRTLALAWRPGAPVESALRSLAEALRALCRQAASIAD